MTGQVRDVEVLVVGGGSAGAVAAIAAARMGAKTLIIDANSFLGGTATAALVTPMMGNHVDNKPLNTGISEEINNRLAKTGDGATAPDGNNGWFNPEKLKFVLEDIVTESGASILYFCFVREVIMDGQRITGVRVNTKSGPLDILANIIIDASGDGDIAYLAGAPFESGRPEDGMNQAMSMRFHMGNVDFSRLVPFLNTVGGYTKEGFLHAASVWNLGYPLETYFEKAVQDGVLERSDGDYFQFFSIPGRPNELAFNCPRISGEVNGTNVEHLTLAAIRGRRIISRLETFLKTYIPGFENAYIVMTSSMVGIRESRRITGEYQLTEEDVLGAVKFPDAIARNCYPVDIHNPLKGKGKDNDYVKLTHLLPGDYHEVPYRCLVPLQVDGLLVAGRCISATFIAQSAIRIESNCRAFGEAAGTAAAMCIKKGVLPRDINGILLREVLTNNGCNL